MPTIAIERAIPGTSAAEAYETSLNKLPDLEFVIWKTRPLAWLIIANRELPEGTVNTTISFRPTEVTSLSLSLACETMSEQDLQAIGEELADALISLFETDS
jgi:hypothetical protein